ncbi:TA system VapC family ribonuclease toxin [Euzebya tangerina]|uniref:TA system VapC family ribonuclease toxin n=1 Tax=Euzebya tangerina TaxID=591198 RepID=UPI000E3164A9|nr:TA system VapC family ribonuclease toxin [Euzebya tangerina]
MILPDVNVLVYAFKAESPNHEQYADWLNAVVLGSEQLALVDTVLAGLVRVVTNGRVFDSPAPTDQALQFVHQLITAPRATWLPAGPIVWQTMQRLAEADPLIAANKVPDAFLAALALSHGARIATEDRGFARYPKLRFFAPV